MPKRESGVQPQVGGRVIRLHPALEPGGFVAGGETLLAIDRKDYEHAVEQARAALVQAETNRVLAVGQHAVAVREWVLLDGDAGETGVEADLAMRRPQLRSAEATVASARDRLAQARLNLARSEVEAPYDALVRQRNVDVGELVGPQTPVARLVGVDAFRIEAAVPVEDLQWLDLPDDKGQGGASASVVPAGSGDETVSYPGRVIRLRPGVDAGGRMAQPVIEVIDPMGRVPANANRPPLLLGTYVQVMIEGKTVDNVSRIPWKAVREGNRVWLVNDRNELAVREIEIVRERENDVLARGLRPGELVVTSRIGTPLPGTPLNIAEDSAGGASGDLGRTGRANPKTER